MPYGRRVSGLTGWQQVALGFGAVSVSGVVALIGQWISRKGAKEITDRWRADYRALEERWQTDRQDVDRRRDEDDQQLTSRWSRERTLDLLDKALTRALSTDERVQHVGLVQLEALSDSSLLQRDEEGLIDKVLDAVVAGLSTESDALREAEDDNAEVVRGDYAAEGGYGGAGVR
jgi:hypothetical protein